MDVNGFISSFASAAFAFLVAFTLTPPVRVFAYLIGAIDIPRDGRRMHADPIPRLGGLAIFLAFFLCSAVFCKIDQTMLSIWIGGFVIVVMGVFDDIYNLHPLIKLGVQVIAALIAVAEGMTVDFISLFGHYIPLGVFAVPVTVLWIVGLTNAMNLIDGLDGLSCGVSVISSLSLYLVMLMRGDSVSAAITLILAGSCLGFLPFNTNPARIFMGDTGAQFLGYTLSLLSVSGLFKTHTVISFFIPLSIFGFPLVDTGFAFCRRILHGQSPFHADRGHLHHRLIDMGFNQKQTVMILYSICAILGISAVMFSEETYLRAFLVILIGVLLLLLYMRILRNPHARMLSGLDAVPVIPKDEIVTPEQKAEELHELEEDARRHSSGPKV